MKKTVLITGASSGIGKRTAMYFQSMGWNVAATMRKPEQERELGSLPGIKLYPLDVLDENSIASAIEKAVRDFGQIDVIVNNAGYGTLGAFEAASIEQIQKQFDTNVFGLMSVIRAILPYFRKRRGGVIINISSVGGNVTFPLYSLYHATKWAVEGFSESLRYELGALNIRVKIVEPGPIKTDFYSRSLDVFKKDGLTDYDDYVDRVTKKMQNFERGAVDALVVAKRIFKAANDGSGRLRYSAGGGAPLLLFLRRILPNRIFFSIVRKAVE